MLDKFVANIVASYLGKYFANLDKNQVKVSMWQGNVVLHDLILKENALRSLELPISIKHGVIGLLQVIIPWTRLRSESIRVELSDIDITVHPKKAAKYDASQEEADQYEAKMEQLAIFEELRGDREQQELKKAAGEDDDAASLEASKDQSFMARLRSTMVNNIQITVTNVKLRYEDNVTDTTQPIAMEAKLDKLTIQSCDEFWEPAFSPNDSRLYFKLAQLVQLGITVQSDGGMRYVCAPVDVTVNAQHQPVPFDPQVPKWVVNATVTPTQIRIDRKQWDAVWRSVRYVREFEYFDAFRQFRPASDNATQDPKGWWQYAIRSVLFVIRQKRKRLRFSWSEYVETKRLRGEYMELHKRRQKGDWLMPLTVAEEQRCQELEHLLPIDVLKRGRSLAYARLVLEEQEHEAHVQYLARQKQCKAGGWWAWWTGQGGTGEATDEPPDEEVDRVWGIIDADQWDDKQRRVIADELGISMEDASTSSTTPALAAHASTFSLGTSFTSVSIELLSYSGTPFALFSLNECAISYDATEKSYRYGVAIADLLVSDATSTSTVHSSIFRVARDRAKAGKVCIAATYEHLNEAVSKGVSYRAACDAQPCDVTVSVPWLQQCVAFWGVNAVLVGPDSRKDSVTSTLPVVSQLSMWYEKNLVMETQVMLSDWRLLIVEPEQYSVCCVNLPLLTVSNDAADQVKKGLKYRGKQATQLEAIGVAAQDWFKELTVSISKFSIDSFWGINSDSECRVFHEMDVSLRFKTLVVRRNYALPLFSATCQVTQPIRIDSDRAGLFVMFSAISLVTEFINNASGRGSALVEVSSDVATTVESFRAVVIGPRSRFLGEGEDMPTDLAGIPCATRLVEVNRGYVQAYHDTRPSMAFAKLELRGDACTIEANEESCIATVYVHQGGEDQACRKRTAAAKELLAECGIPLMDSIPQQRFAIGHIIDSNKALNGSKDCTIAGHSEQEIWDAFQQICTALRTVPCSCASFLFETPQQLKAFERSLRRSIVGSTQPADAAAVPTEPSQTFSEEQKKQQLFAFNVRCPSMMWIIDEMPEVTVSLNEAVNIHYDVTMFDRNIVVETDGVLINADDKGDSIVTIPKSGNPQAPSFSFSFLSSMLIPPSLSIRSSSKISLRLNESTVSSIELIWDTIGIALMRHLTFTLLKGIPFGEFGTYTRKAPYISLECNFQKGVALSAFYEDDTAAMDVEGSALLLKWSMSESSNIAEFSLLLPQLVMKRDATPLTREVVRPRDDLMAGATPPTFNFRYEVLYKPAALSDSDWFLTANGGCGFRYTHFMELRVHACRAIYRQTALWTLIEYFTNGLMTRITYAAVRPSFTLSVSAPRWDPQSLPPMKFGYALLHQDIELTDCVAALPFSPTQEPALIAWCPRMALRSVMNFPDDKKRESERFSDVRLGTRIDFELLSVFAHEAPGPNTGGIVEGLSLQFNVWFENVGMMKRASEYTMEVILHDFLFRGRVDNFCQIFQWITGCFQEKWNNKYPYKVWPAKPFHVFNTKSYVYYDWHIAADRFLLHFLPDVSTTAASPEALSREFVFDAEGIDVGIAWSKDASFLSTYRVLSAYGWNLSNVTGRKSRAFVKDVREIASNKYRFLRIPRVECPSTTTPPPEGGGSLPIKSAIDISYGWTGDSADKVVFGKYNIGTVELDLLPYSILAMRDTMLSLRVRNAFGTLLRWPPYVVGVAPPPYDPMKQEWRIVHDVAIETLGVVTFSEPSKTHRSTPLIQMALKGAIVENRCAKYGKDASTTVVLTTIVCGVCDAESRSVMPLIVPKSQTHRDFLLTLMYSAEKGVSGELDCVWIIAPTRESIKQIKRSLIHPCMTKLSSLGTYEEERGLKAPAPAKSTYPDVSFRLISPCIVVTEHADTSRGIVANFGLITLKNKNLQLPVSELSAQLEGAQQFAVVMEKANVTSLHHAGQYLMHPASMQLEGTLRDSGRTELNVVIGSLRVDVTQEYYESLLYGAVRHLVLDEAALVERQETFVATTSTFSPEAEAVAAKNIKAVVNWDRMRLRIYGEGLAVFFSTGVLGVEYTTNEGKSVMDASVENLEIGVEGKRSLLRIAKDGAPLTLSIKATAATNIKQIKGSLGTCSVYLEHDALVPALSFLSEPYVRIVVPTYGVSEVVEVSGDTLLNERLVLSSRKVLHVSAKEQNRIVIDCNGHEVFFIEAERPIVILDAAVTLVFLNGKINLYDNPVEHYVVAGNGAYVLIPENLNLIQRRVREVQGWRTEELPDSAMRLKIDANFSFELPEATPTAARRLLVLRSNVSIDYNSEVRAGSGAVKGTVAVQQLLAECLYFTSGNMETPSDFSSLLSSWELTVDVDGKHPVGGKYLQNINIISERGVDIRLRYGDFQLVMSALQQAQKALAGLGSTVAAPLPTDAEVMKTGGAKQLSDVIKQISTTLPHIGVYLVDDSQGSIDQPLVYLSFTEISTPTLETTCDRVAVHLATKVQLEYFDQESSMWQPLLEKVAVDFALKETRNLTLEDLKGRKGHIKAGVHVRPIHLHVTPMAAKAIALTQKLMQRVAQPAPQGSAAEASAVTSGAKTEFHVYHLEQHLGEDLIIGFADDPDGRLPQPFLLEQGVIKSFNFPRIQGREIPVSQHIVTLRTHSTDAGVVVPVAIGRVGVYLAQIPFGVHTRDIVADVFLREGHKHVLFRTNVTFINNLPFNMCLAGVGIVHPHGVTAIPTDALRKRCCFCPQISAKCRDVSMGVHYESLPALHSQQYLCTCQIEDAENTAQQAVYFLMDFAPRNDLGSSHLKDGKVSFEAPFSIQNNTGADIEIGLYYMLVDDRKKSVINFGRKDHARYVHMTTIQIESEGSAPITQVDPLRDVYMDVVLTQPTGQSLARTGLENAEPALIRCRIKKNRSRVLFLYDEKGQELALCLDYGYRTVTISCPFWIVNQTQHYLQIAQRHPKKDGCLCAGVTTDGIPPSQSPFLLNSRKLLGAQSQRRHIYVSVGRHSVGGTVEWSPWSQQVNVEAIGDCFFCVCGEGENVVTLSYSVNFVGGAINDTRAIKFTPRWIFINRCLRPLTFVPSVVLAEPVTLPTGHCVTIDTCASTNCPNFLHVKYHKGEDIADCEWSERFCIDDFSDYTLNLCYIPKENPTHQEYTVVHVSCYHKGSICYVAVEKSVKPPFVIENRSESIVSIKQIETARELVVYPKKSKGFVWENATIAPRMELCVWNVDDAKPPPQDTLCRCTIDFTAAEIVRSGGSRLSQEVQLSNPKQKDMRTLFVRVRAYDGRYAVSVTQDDQIGNVCLRAVPQFAFSLKLESVNCLVSSSAQDVALFTVQSIDVGLSQARSATDATQDEQALECRVGTIQLDDERKEAKRGVVLKTGGDQAICLSIARLMDRRTPMLQTRRFHLTVRPITIHLEDTFLFEVFKLQDKITQIVFGESQNAKVSKYESLPWSKELERGQLDEQSVLWRDAFIEDLMIDQMLVSISLYRGEDSSRDPIRDKLGIVSMFVRSVEDARFDWRPLAKTDVSQKLWLIGTTIRDLYLSRLTEQVLNIVHVTGLDAMRGLINDLLIGYMDQTSSSMTFEQNAPMVRKRQETNFAQMKTIEDDKALGDWDESKDTDLSQDATRAEKIARLRRKGRLTRALVTMEEWAANTGWKEFVESVSHSELREHGHLAISQVLRERSMTEGPKLVLCKRCEVIEAIRARRMESDSMSVLPHPTAGQIDWCELAHHVTWDEFAAMCTPDEVHRYANLVKDSLLGTPHHVVRIDAAIAWCIE